MPGSGCSPSNAHTAVTSAAGRAVTRAVTAAVTRALCRAAAAAPAALTPPRGPGRHTGSCFRAGLPCASLWELSGVNAGHLYPRLAERFERLEGSEQHGQRFYKVLEEAGAREGPCPLLTRAGACRPALPRSTTCVPAGEPPASSRRGLDPAVWSLLCS